jgi:hypothetical protein
VTLEEGSLTFRDDSFEVILLMSLSKSSLRRLKSFMLDMLGIKAQLVYIRLWKVEAEDGERRKEIQKWNKWEICGGWVTD